MRYLALICSLLVSSVCCAERMLFVDALDLARKQVLVAPNDAKARYALARLCAIGFANNPEHVEVSTDGSGVLLLPKSETVLVERKAPITEGTRALLKEAVTNFSRATRFDSSSALYTLANAWTFEQLAVNWDAVMADQTLGEFGSAKDVWTKVSAEYRRAWSMAKDKDRERTVTSEDGPDALVSKQAALCMLRLRKAGLAKVTDAEAKRFQDTIDALGG